MSTEKKNIIEDASSRTEALKVGDARPYDLSLII